MSEDDYCNNCGMHHDPNDKASCIEGHGDDPREAAARRPDPGDDGAGE